MKTFLDNVLSNILDTYKSLGDSVFVLPSSRAVRTFRTLLAKQLNTPIFSPTIISVESFIGQIAAPLELADDVDLLIELYKAYSKENPSKENFAGFQAWGNLLISDFNEIDRYLVSPEKIFQYLTAIARIKDWNVQSESTEMVSSYLEFSKNLLQTYTELNTSLSKKKIGYQGMLYRRAVENTSAYLKANKGKKHFFIGLNALNEAEKQLIKSILEEGDGKIYWDIDPYFMENNYHDAGYFIRQYAKKWSHLSHKMAFPQESDFIHKKDITITGVAKNHSQIKYVGHLLKDMDVTSHKTAWVLADESLLPLVLNSIPKTVGEANITMGYPLSKTNLANFFLSLCKLQQQDTAKGWYHKDLMQLLSNPVVKDVLEYASIHDIIAEIKQKNISFISLEYLKEHMDHTNSRLVSLLDIEGKPTAFLEQAIALLHEIHSNKKLKENTIENASVPIVMEVLGEVKNHLSTHDFLTHPKTMLQLIQDGMAKETLDFKGNPDCDLQIMGVLETRGLDFDTVIITSLNEGILPAGKTISSFIPFDVKRAFDLPTIKEKDAVYTYHFYRLLQRAKTVHLVYNTEPDVLLGGEKSRFILQLQTDSNIAPFLKHNLASASIPSAKKIVREISKTTLLQEDLQNLATKGFSPSSLSNYIKDPYLFYKKHVLKIDEVTNVDEQMAHNVFGTIVHDSMEQLYRPFIGNTVSKKMLEASKKRIDDEVMAQFEKHYAKKTILEGKNLIALHVIKRYVESVLDFDMFTAAKHDLKILGVEENLGMDLYTGPNTFLARLKGKLDRIDRVDGTLRIIDYKTGTVEKSGFNLTSIEEVFVEKKYDKAFQLLCYSLMYLSTKNTIPSEAAVLPIKKMNDGLMKIYFKEERTNQLTHDHLDEFQKGLVGLITDILDPNIPFAEKP